MPLSLFVLVQGGRMQGRRHTLTQSQPRLTQSQRTFEAKLHYVVAREQNYQNDTGFESNDHIKETHSIPQLSPAWTPLKKPRQDLTH